MHVLHGKICEVIVQYWFIIKTYTGFDDMELNILMYALNEFKVTYHY